MTRILVCGGRNFSDYAFLSEILTQHKSEMSVLIHGGARGADELAGKWAHANGVEVSVYHAEWNRYGKDAGPVRNVRMLELGKPDLVIAFPGGNGTEHMVKTARAAGVKVRKA